MRLGRAGGPKTPGEDPPAVATGHLGHLAGCSDADTRGPHLSGAQGPAIHRVFLHESGGYGAPPCRENLRTMTSGSALRVFRFSSSQGRLPDARRDGNGRQQVYQGPGSLGHGSGLLQPVLVFQWENPGACHDAIYGSALFSLAAREGMGNLITVIVFFGIGTWPHCRRGRRDNIFVLQGLQGRAG